jgi:hypothetical protein
MERRELIESLLQRQTEHDWQGCCEVAFRILYGLPVETQMNLAKVAMQRYLEIFRRKWPDVAWPAQLLSNVDGWVTSHGRGVPSDPDQPDPADSAFLFAFDGLVLAASCPGDQLVLTSACMAAVTSAINARQCNVWIADDPQGVDLWRLQGYFPGRSVGENRPAIAVAEREWEEVAKWLRNEEVWQHPEVFSVEETERALARLKRHEMRLILPDRSK